MKLSCKVDFDERTLQQSHLPVLDGLRGVAIGLVLLHHLFGQAFGFCWIGVELFFVLSGFLITRILLKTVGEKNYFRNFYARRTLRIFPLYYAVLVVVLIILPLLFVTFRKDIAYLLNQQVWYWTYMQNWLAAKEGWLPGKNIILSHFWSLAIEEQYYLFWPLMVFLLRGKKLIAGIVVLILCSLGLRLGDVFANPGYYVATITRMDSLLTGSLLALLLQLNADWVKRTIIPVLIASALVMAIALGINPDPKYSNPFMHHWGYTVLSFFFAALIGIALSGNKNLFARMLTMRPLMLLGKYSYGIYVFHFLLYWMLKDRLYSWFSGHISNHLMAQLSTSLVCLGITLLVSVASFHLLEQPFLRLKKYFGGN